MNNVCVLSGTRDSSARNVLLATKEIQPDWDLLAPVFHVTAKEEGLVIQTQVSEMTPGPDGWGHSQATEVSRGRESCVGKTMPELISEMGKD